MAMTQSSSTTAKPTPSATVLVVDDEDCVRRVLRILLVRNGYRVLEAPDGASALRALEALDRGPDLLIADVVMPGMDGLELARRVRDLRPRTETLFISGYAADDVVPAGPSALGGHFLQKPFSSSSLLASVRRLLPRR